MNQVVTNKTQNSPYRFALVYTRMSSNHETNLATSGKLTAMKTKSANDGNTSHEWADRQ